MKNNLLDFDAAKRGQIKNIFFTLKMLSLLFAAVPLFQYFSQPLGLHLFDYTFSLYVISVSIIIICLVLLLWMLVFRRKSHKRIFVFFEVLLFICAFIFSIFISGANTSYYKFLFLFLIISYTIEHGMKLGLFLSGISSAVVIAFDVIFSSEGSVNKYLENDLALVAMFFMVAWTLGYYVRLEKEHIQFLTDCSNIDALTKVYSHRYFHQAVSDMCDECVKRQSMLSLLIVDIDYFKKFNNILGHKQGDAILSGFAQHLKKQIRDRDVLCRYGGDQFCIILPDTGSEVAADLADKIRRSAADFTFSGQQFMPHNDLTVSIGVSALDNDTGDYNTLIENADTALGRAKFLRKNKVEVYSPAFDKVKQLGDISVGFEDSLKQLKALIMVINSRDTYTYKHVERVVGYCGMMADSLNLNIDDKRKLIYGAYLHDLGKINVSKETLIADNKLSENQWDELRRHPVDSAEILGQIDGFENIIPIVLQHHERFGGGGYPNGLKGDEICYLARVLTLADSFDAMTSQRTYQKAKTFEEAFEEIRRCKGSQFDPGLTEIFINTIRSM